MDAIRGRSFLTLKVADLRATARRAAGRLPVLLMNSFATDAPTAALLAAQPPRPELALSTFAQAISVRLTEAGDIFTGADGHPSLYAPGHGDLTDALRRFALAALRAAGVRTLVMANLDNLAAGVEPAIVGHHRERHAQMTVEVVRKEKGDKGGAPALLDGRLQIVESMRFPPTFDQDAIPVFNTNTFVLELEPLDRDFPLDQFCVKKKVDDRDAIQFERLAGQLSAFLETGCIEVPRAGPDGRFLPAKDAEEITARRAQFEEVLGARGALEE
ncbi:MAG: UTP--glucose-1-phosphate uridylyltransferase [Planctomycetes bacterium]|nr:UTP--glucose-1-phosphate uridylyltransferase [Planctomycetota bacterium]